MISLSICCFTNSKKPYVIKYIFALLLRKHVSNFNFGQKKLADNNVYAVSSYVTHSFVSKRKKREEIVCFPLTLSFSLVNEI